MTVAKKCGMIISAENEETLLSADLQKPERFFSKSEYANVAQSVEQLIRNQQVVCSSHIISSRKQRKSNDFRCFHNF